MCKRPAPPIFRSGAQVSRPALLRAALLILLIPTALCAQSIQTISPRQCVWRAGDNPAWAAPNLDESGWKPLAQWNLGPDDAHVWVRCHADLSALRGAAQPAIQVTLYAAYQLYLNGALIGGVGNVRSGNFSLNTIRSFPAPESLLASPATTLAARIAFRFFGISNGQTWTVPPVIYAGDQPALDAQRAATIQAQVPIPFFNFLCHLVIGVLGLVLLAQFLQDRGRYDLLLLGIFSVALADIYATYFCSSVLVNFPDLAVSAVFGAADVAAHIAQTWFFFALAKRRVPLLFWVLIGIMCFYTLLFESSLFLPVGEAFRVVSMDERWMLPVFYGASAIADGAAPLVAFWPYRRIARRMRPMAGLCMVWGATTMLFFSARPGAWLALAFGVRADVLLRWHVEMTHVQVFVGAAVLVALMWLLSRDQRRTAEERAVLAGEMQAAGEIQRMLAPAKIESAPGLHIDVAFHPMREVGGDFYLCRVLPLGRQRLLVGDVSGKGAAAAMAATLLLGGAAARDSDSPAALLEHLNRVFHENRLGGFATCLCADIGADGSISIANAGHLAPYCRGDELAVLSGLPLGLRCDQHYEEIDCRLSPGETLTFLSDGVVEARNKIGELFGFERTREISNQPAEEIARAAQTHGQHDDITVLTLKFAPVEVLHA